MGEVREPWQKHDGGPNPAPGQAVDLQWGMGLIECQPSERVNWTFRWAWKPSRPAAQPTSEGKTS